MENENKKPTKKYRSGSTTLTVWTNTNEKGEWKTFQLERNYKNKEEKWQTTNSYRSSDLHDIILLVSEAYKDDKLKDK